jgi:hypothetical protein
LLRIAQVPLERLSGTPPHVVREDVTHSRFDPIAELLRGGGVLIGLGDRLYACADFLDRAAIILLTKVQVQCPRCDQRGDIGRVAELKQSGDEVREAVQQVGPLDGRVGR